MVLRTTPEQSLLSRLLPASNPDRSDRDRAWEEWQTDSGGHAVRRFIAYKNDTTTPDGDIYQDSLLTAYLEVERGGYQPRPGVPFAAYVKGIAHNKIREARRRQRRYVPLDDQIFQLPANPKLQPDHVFEHREQKACLQAGLAQLSQQRRLVIEGFLQGKRTREIAEELSISEDLVRQHKSRSLRKLRAMNLMFE